MNRSLCIAGISTALLLLLAVFLHLRPLRLPTSQVATDPPPPWRSQGNFVLLLLEENPRGSDREWLNLLEERFGDFDVQPLEKLVREAGAHRLLVIPKHSLAALDTLHAPFLDGLVEAGAQILMEAPSAFWSRRLGLSAQGVESRSRLPWPQGGRERRQIESRLGQPRSMAMPHQVVSYWPGRGDLGMARPLLSPGGRPLLWAIDRGRGRWTALALDFAQLARDLRAVQLPGEQITPLWLDRWLDVLMASELAREPWPRMWPAPYEADGCLLLLQPGLDPSVLRGHWPDANGAATAPELRRWFGLGRFRPLYRMPSLAEQLALADGEPTVHRLHDGIGALDPDLLFASLAAAGIRLDFSLGSPTQRPTASLLPHRPLRRDGRLFALHALPIWGDVQAPQMLLRRQLRENAGGAHGCITLLAPSDAFDEEALRRSATKHGHQALSPDEFLDFWSERGARSLGMEFDGEWLTVRVARAPIPTSARVPLAVALPQRWQGRSLVDWQADWPEARARRARSHELDEMLFALPHSAAELRVRYEGADGAP